VYFFCGACCFGFYRASSVQADFELGRAHARTDFGAEKSRVRGRSRKNPPYPPLNYPCELWGNRPLHAQPGDLCAYYVGRAVAQQDRAPQCVSIPSTRGTAEGWRGEVTGSSPVGTPPTLYKPVDDFSDRHLHDRHERLPFQRWCVTPEANPSPRHPLRSSPARQVSTGTAPHCTLPARSSAHLVFGQDP
jgi:hypothetical protein